MNRGLSRHGNASLIRRPSTLRRSYTEFDDNEDDDNKGDSASETVNKVEERTSKIKERPVSLRDITEELTKISNSAGLTDNDAITLARTLSMAGSYSDKKINHNRKGIMMKEILVFQLHKRILWMMVNLPPICPSIIP